MLKKYRSTENGKAKKKILVYDAGNIPENVDRNATDGLVRDIKEKVVEQLHDEFKENKQGIKYQISIQTVFKREVLSDNSERETTLERLT